MNGDGERYKSNAGKGIDRTSLSPEEISRKWDKTIRGLRANLATAEKILATPDLSEEVRNLMGRVARDYREFLIPNAEEARNLLGVRKTDKSPTGEGEASSE